MSSSSIKAYQLTVSEVYPRQSLYGFQLAPDGSQWSFLLQRDERVEEITEGGKRKFKVAPVADLCFIPSDGGYPRPFSAPGGPSNPVVWSPDGKWLAFSHEAGLQLIPAAGGERRTIYSGELYSSPLGAGDAHLGNPRWSPDGRSILFATREELRATLRLASVDGKLQRNLFSFEGYITGWEWAPDGNHILFVTRSENGWVGDVRLLNLETEEIRLLWEEDNYEYQQSIAVWSPDGEHILFGSNRSGWAKLWLATQGEVRPFTLGDWDDYAFRFSPDGMQVVYASREAQNGNGDDLWIIPFPGGAARRLTHHPGVNIPLAWSKDNRIYYWHSSPTEPGDLWSVPSNDEEARRLTWNAPVELERKLRAPEEVVITNDDGTRIPALIYLPAYSQEGEKYPAIVWIRGGPTGVCRFEFAPFYNWLANQGYVVITPNYRGSVGHGVKYMAAVAGEGLGKNDLSDVLATGRYVSTLSNVGLSRGIGVGGRSWGGYLTLMSVTQAPEEFSCAVAGAAISDWMIQQAQTEVRYYDRWLVGGWVYDQLERIKVPLLVFHGEEDQDVPFAQIQVFAERAKQSGARIEYITYPREGHGNRKLENQQDTLDRIRAFFRQHLQPWNFRDNPSAN